MPTTTTTTALDRGSRSRSPRRRVLAVLLLVLVALLAGSQLPRLLDGPSPDASGTGDPQAAGAEPEQPSEQPSARPSVVDLVPPTRLPTLPEAGRANTEAGATAFVRYWFDTLNYSLARGDTEALAGVTGAGCQQCTGWLIAISRWQADSASLEGGLTSPLELAIGPFADAEPVQFAATFLTTPATVTSASGEVEEYPGGMTRGGATVRWSNDRWQMTDVVVDVDATTTLQGAP